MADRPQAWTPNSWRGRPALQQPDYPDPALAEQRLAEIAAGGPLVSAEECAALRRACATAAMGAAFILQAGDCAESLAADPAEAADTLSGMVDRLSEAASRPVVPVGRIGGQFAKPRSALEEQRDGFTLPVYRGDAVNGASFDRVARSHDADRMLAAYRHSGTTIAHLRRHGLPIFASHEALLLPYEQALCFRGADGRWWAGSGHMLWIGERTRQVDGAHVEFVSGIANTVGVKCGPSMTEDDLLRLAERLDPTREPGKLLCILRLGADAIGERFPALLRVAQREGLAAGWILDPMHGNTRRIMGRKQRRLSDMLRETEAFVAICRSEGIVPAGIHLEVTTESAAECIGLDGADPMADFPCDPRLTEAQALPIVRAAAAGC